MSQPIAISPSTAIAGLHGWKVAAGKDAIEKTFIFDDFKEAFSWMTRIALKAEQINHHPEWFNVYKTVTVTLTTHDANGVTTLDVDLATYMDACAR